MAKFFALTQKSLTDCDLIVLSVIAQAGVSRIFFALHQIVKMASIMIKWLPLAQFRLQFATAGNSISACN